MTAPEVHELLVIEQRDGDTGRWFCTCGQVGAWRQTRHVVRGHSMHRARQAKSWTPRGAARG